MAFKNYNKEELINEISGIDIQKIDNQIITKYKGRIIKTATVSELYEIFDIVQYLKDKIDLIEKNFNIVRYSLTIKGGRQSLELLSDTVEIAGHQFYKSFYIINSTDKSRRLNFNIGLRSLSGGFYTVANNLSLSKKHLKGITQIANDISTDIDGETFDEQINSIESLSGHKVQFSKIRGVILGDGDIPDVNHRKFDAFKNSVRFSNLELSREVRNMLAKPSIELVDITSEVDFYLDAILVLSLYMKIFSREDSHIVRVETQRIMGITQCAVRNSILESLGI